MSLRRSIGTWDLFFASVGGMVGSGWLFGPFNLAVLVGPASPISWIIGGFLMMIVAMTFAELSSTFPFSGGTVRFLQLSHGPLVSFTIAWVSWIAAAAVAPIETMALIQYASNYIHKMMEKVQGTNVLTGMGMGVAACLMLVMCFINIMGIKFLSKTNSFVVIFKLFVPVLTLFVLLIIDFHPSNFVSHGFSSSGLKNILMALPTAGVIFSFIGYSPAIQLAGEAKTPHKSIPIAILGALFFCIFLYVLLQIAFIGAVSPDSLEHKWAHLSFSGDTGPFAGLAVTLGTAWLAMILFADAAISPFGTALIYTAATSRICYAMGENGYFPTPLMKLNRSGVPVRIVFLNFLIGTVLLLPFPSWQKLVGFLVSALVFAYAVGPLALPVLRKTLPQKLRPFSVPCPKLICPLAFYICNLIIYWSGWLVVSKIVSAIILGYLFLLIFLQTPKGRKLNLQWEKAWWIFIYIAFLSVISYFGAFGGRNDLSFGWDFLIIGVFSWLIFTFSQFLALRQGCNSVDPPIC